MVRLVPPIVGVRLPGTFYGVRVEDWGAPQEGEAWLLKNPTLDRLSKVHPATPLTLFVPILTAAIALARSGHGLSWGAVSALAAAGLFFWTFAEYVLHRGMFHFTPRSRPALVAAYLIHGVHHAYPDDPSKLVMPPVLSLPLAAAFYLLFTAILGPAWGKAFFGGFILGYLWYDMTHYIVHARPMRSAWARAIVKNHMLHHFQVPTRRFGVSNPLWDYVFRTR